jgi:UDP-4-amino-4,6-dideoxy-N-acetyl-beta-L-altrosamine N-acetyltransferase
LIIKLDDMVLRQVGLGDIEQIRQWRNSTEVSKYMEFRDHITPEMQTMWFEKICQKGDYYFMVIWKGESVGVINLKDIDNAKGTAEGGIFLVAKFTLNSYLPYFASICSTEFGYNKLGLNKIYAHILDENKRAVRYNLSLGYEPTEKVNVKGNRLFVQTSESYKYKISKIKKVLGITTVSTVKELLL